MCIRDREVAVAVHESRFARTDRLDLTTNQHDACGVPVSYTHLDVYKRQGWVEFLFMYYAQRFGAHPEIVNGVVTTTTTYVQGIAANPVLSIDGIPVQHMQLSLIHI